MKKTPVIGLIVAVLAYVALFFLGASSGLIHPACFAYAGTVLPLLFAFCYLYAAANLRCFGAAALLNGTGLLIALIMGEGNAALVIGMLLFAAIAELIRLRSGYDTRKGVRRSFLALAFSFYAFCAHWWTNTAGSLAEAVEEMPAGYAAKMEQVIGNIPMLLVMLVLTVPVAMLGMYLAEKLMKKQAAKLR